jgi:hypothetical protein
MPDITDAMPSTLDSADFPTIEPHCKAHRVMVFNGSSDTNIHSGTDYKTITLQDVFHCAGHPSAVPKAEAPAFIPSSYCKFDGRAHQIQRERGQFVSINGDIDVGNHSIEVIGDLVDEFFGCVATLIYGSASATPENRKWRIVVPLEIPFKFVAWQELSEAFYSFMESNGIKMDWSLSRAGQPIFLPNVPPDKRGNDGTPTFYQYCITDGPSASPDSSVAAKWIQKSRNKQTADELAKTQARDAARAAMEKRKQSGGDSVIEAFNKSHTIVEMLEANGYERSPSNDADWRSPYQSSDSYGTRNFGSYWISLSQSDADAQLGAASAGAHRFGDAFDIYRHFDHGGDVKAAVKAAANDLEVAAPLQEAHQTHQMAAGADPVPLDWQALPDGPPEVPFLIPEWLPDNVVTLFSAHGGTGKSYMSLYIALCLAVGRHPFTGESLPRVKVLLYSAEDTTTVMQSRLMRYMKHLSIKAADLVDWLLVFDATDSDNVLFTGDEKLGGRTTKRFEWLGREVSKFGASLLIFDNASDALDANENDRAKVRQFVSSLKRLAPAVLLLAHVDAASSMADPIAAKGYSGSTGWNNSARSRWFMAREKNDDVVLRQPKVNYARSGSEVVIRWDETANVFLVKEAISWTQKPADHRAVLLGLFAAVQDVGETVSAASNSTNSVFNKIKELPGFPPRLKSGEVAREVGAWKLAGLVKVEDFARSNRTRGTRLVLTDAGRGVAHKVQTMSRLDGLPMPTLAHPLARTTP